MSAFIVRKISQHNINPAKQKQQQKLSAQPNKIVFKNQQENESVSVAKIKLTNMFNHSLQFKIKQPKQQCFKVKYGKNILAVNQSIQIFVFYNIKANTGFYNDQFTITACTNQIYTLTIPILVRSDNQFKSIKKTQRKSSKTKENLKIIKMQTQNRPFGQNKRKAGIMLSISSMKNNEQQINNVSSLLDRIQSFEKQYIKIQKFLKNKTIKNEIFRGQKPVTKQKHYQVISFNLTIELMAKQLIKQQILRRHKNKKTRYGPSVRIMQNIKLQWNTSRNIRQITYKKGLQKLFRQIRNFVIYHRFRKMNKILSIYRNLREQQNVEQPQTKIINKPITSTISNIAPQSINKVQIMSNLQQQSIILNQNIEDKQYQLQLQQKKKHDYYCRKISKLISNKKQRSLGADFTQFSLSPKLLPLDFSSQLKNHYFQIKPRVGFDNWVALEQSTVYNHQLMGYHKIDRLHEWQCHPSFQSVNRSLSLSLPQDANSGSAKDIANNTHMQLDWMKIHKYDRNNKQEYLNKSDQKTQQMNCFKKQQKVEQNKYDVQLFREYWQQKNAQTRRYKNYSKDMYQIDYLPDHDKHYGQIDIFKPFQNRIDCISQINYSKEDYGFQYEPIDRFQVQRFMSNPNVGGQQLIYQISKEDVIDFDEPSPTVLRKIQYIQYLQEKQKVSRLENKNKTYLQSQRHQNNNQHLILINEYAYFSQIHKNKVKNHENYINTLEKGTAFNVSLSFLVNYYKNSEKWEIEGFLRRDQTYYEKIIENLSKNMDKKLLIAKRKISSFNDFIRNKVNIIYF